MFFIWFSFRVISSLCGCQIWLIRPFVECIAFLSLKLSLIPSSNTRIVKWAGCESALTRKIWQIPAEAEREKESKQEKETDRQADALWKNGVKQEEVCTCSDPARGAEIFQTNTNLCMHVIHQSLVSDVGVVLKEWRTERMKERQLNWGFLPLLHDGTTVSTDSWTAALGLTECVESYLTRALYNLQSNLSNCWMY